MTWIELNTKYTNQIFEPQQQQTKPIPKKDSLPTFVWASLAIGIILLIGTVIVIAVASHSTVTTGGWAASSP